MADQVTVQFKDDQKISPDGISVENYKKKKAYTSRSNIEKRIFEHKVQKGEAEYVTPGEGESKTKTAPPKETKSKKKSSKSDK